MCFFEEIIDVKTPPSPRRHSAGYMYSSEAYKNNWSLDWERQKRREREKRIQYAIKHAHSEYSHF